MRAAIESDPEGACSVSAMPDDQYVLLSDKKVQLSGSFKLVPVIVGIDRPRAAAVASMDEGTCGVKAKAKAGAVDDSEDALAPAIALLSCSIVSST